jgi:hypothetical protein
MAEMSIATPQFGAPVDRGFGHEGRTPCAPAEWCCGDREGYSG